MAQFKGMLHLLHKRMANVSYPIQSGYGALFKCTGDHRTDPAGNVFLCGRILLHTAWRVAIRAEGGVPPSFYADERMRDSLKTVRSKYRFQRVSF